MDNRDKLGKFKFQSSWNKGKKTPDDTKKKQSEARKRYLKNNPNKIVEQVERLRLINLGNPRTNEEKQKISMGHIKSYQEHPEIKEKLRLSKLGNKNPMFNKKPWNTGIKVSELGFVNYNKGRVFTREERLKISIATKKAMTPEVRIKIGLLAKGRPSSMKGKHHTKEAIEKGRKSQLRLWANPEYAHRMYKKLWHKPNDHELYLDAILQLNFPNEWKYTGHGDLWIEGKNPDFQNIKGRKILIEYNGYRPRHTEKFDKERTLFFKERGWETINIYPKDLYEERIKELINQADPETQRARAAKQQFFEHNIYKMKL